MSTSRPSATPRSRVREATARITTTRSCRSTRRAKSNRKGPPMAFIETSRAKADVLPPGQNPQPDQEDESELDLEREPLEQPEFDDPKERLAEWIKDHNLARYLDYNELGALGALVVREYEIDEQSRSEWKEEAE